ncbi:MAG: DUF1553 domain-containing protein [Pirellulales bacterium]
MNCAKCHDHKYDPIEQADFYRMRAFFEPYHVRNDVVPGEPNLDRDGIPRAFDGLMEAPTYLFVRGDSRNPDKSAAISPGVPTLLAFRELAIEPVELPSTAWRPDFRPWVLENHAKSAKEALDKATEDLRKAREQSSAPSVEQAEAEKIQAAVTLAESNLAVAEAELESVQKRIEATRASAPGADEGKAREANVAAVRAERQLALAKARRGVAQAETKLSQAAADKKDAVAKELEKATSAAQNAEKLAESPVGDDAAFTPITGAAWTPTRFLDSTKDDPAVRFPDRSTGRRKALAEWITDRRNPLTARVAANQIWMRHMGEPLVPTVFDFGRNGVPPANQELLDWLAAELMDNGWSMKHLHRVIVTSAAYRMSSFVRGGDTSAANDPDNRHWWRRVPIRLESQAIRDSVLALAGTLDSASGGPPVMPAQQAASTRRSLYFFHSNNERNLFLTTFDEAIVTDCYRREQSVVPQQALALANSALVIDASRRIAERLAKEVADDADFIRKAFREVVGIEAGDAELEAGIAAFQAWRDLPDGYADDARARFVWALINHNDFVTLR